MVQPMHRSSIQPCDWPISELPGLNPHNHNLLQQCGITTTRTLLLQGSTHAQKLVLANLLHINIRDVNKWVAMADLARIPSIGCQYCGLLLHAGIGSVIQLAQTPTHRLHQQILRLYVSTLQRRDLCPTVDQVQVWIHQAQKLGDSLQ